MDSFFLKDVAKEIGVAPITLKRWLLSGKISDVKRNRNGWRVFNDTDISKIKKYANQISHPAKQLLLLDQPESYNDRDSTFRDSAFNGNKKLAFHRWVPWIAGFSADFVEDCFKNYLKSKNPHELTILDPFAGVGTTLVEGLLHGHNVLGFEINPYAYLACKVKVNAHKYNISEIEKALEKFLRYYQSRENHKSYIPRATIPKDFNTRAPFFSPKVEHKVLIFFDYLSNIKDLEIKELFKLAFGTVMVSFSNYSYEPSLGRRASSGKPDIEDAEVADIIAMKINNMIDDIKEFDELHSDTTKNLEARVYNKSYFDALQFCGKDSIDLLVTSPPYLNNYHYLRNTQPQLHWLDLIGDSEAKKSIEHSSFGKFWQTTRAEKTICPEFKLDRLDKKLAALREMNKDKGIYGGHGWANYAATYFNDSYRFCKVTQEILKPGGVAVVVIGNSILQGIEIETDQIFADISELAGLKKKDILMLRTKRTGSSIIDSTVRAGKTTTKTILYETAVVLSK